MKKGREDNARPFLRASVSIMNKHIRLYIAIQAVAAVFLIMFSLIFVKNVSASEVHTVGNLAGAILPAFPEAEPDFIQALRHPSGEQQHTGFELLARYGYEETDFPAGSLFYRRSLSIFISIFMILIVLSMVSGFGFLYSVKKRQRTQEAVMSSFLERCLSDDYAFLEHPEELTVLQQNGLPDDFLKLLQKLRLKSETLAEEKDHTKTLVTDISHQLKTPLSALKTCFALYQEADTAQEKEEFGDRCRFQLDKLENLTAPLINISRLENAMILLQPAPASLTDILVEAVNGVYAKAAARQISIDTEDFSDLSLHLDRKWTSEALFNILDNAVKYSPPGSTVRIRVQTLYSFVRVEIEDQGIGIPKGEYNNIFRRFYRVRHETVLRSEGSGVGLYLSRKILEEQGGTLSVKAAKGQGSIFVVQLPLSGALLRRH